MRFLYRYLFFAVFLAGLLVLQSCPGSPSTPVTPPDSSELKADVKPESTKYSGRNLNLSEVYTLARDSFQEIADSNVVAGDRILLVPAQESNASLPWRFVPIPEKISLQVYEQLLAAQAKLSFWLAEEEKLKTYEDLVQNAFVKDDPSGFFIYKKDNKNNDVLGFLFSQIQFSAYETFDLKEYVQAHPYFIDSFEGGILDAILRKQGSSVERVSIGKIDSSVLSRVASGSLVFGTNPLPVNSWKDFQAVYGSESTKFNKVLLYSIEQIRSKGSEYIGFSVRYRLLDASKEGKILFSGLKSLYSESMPESERSQMHSPVLSIPLAASTRFKEGIKTALDEQGITSPSTAVLIKTDDISVMGSYRPFAEDSLVEDALQTLVDSTALLSVSEKLAKRSYKKPWQFANATHFINPLQAGDFTDFNNFYGTRFMINYRILWKSQAGIRLLSDGSDQDLQDRILGIMVKVVDMGNRGLVLYSDFLPFASTDVLEKNPVYNAYMLLNSYNRLPRAVLNQGVLDDTQRAVLINRRLALANGMLGLASPDSALAKTLMKRSTITDSRQLALSYFNTYSFINGLKGSLQSKTKEEKESFNNDQVLKLSKTYDQEREKLSYLAIVLLESWMEDGLLSVMLSEGVAVSEKLDSLYARSMLDHKAGRTALSIDSVYLSPILVKTWGLAIKTLYNIDKILYYSLIGNDSSESNSLLVPNDYPLSVYYPFVTSSPDTIQASVVDMANGEYEFKFERSLK